ncbi:MAG: hypothetical protein M0Q49_06895 [Porticoccaceae bacterium]|nr:hypothetical protein [Porticoccaceae bacterium]
MPQHHSDKIQPAAIDLVAAPRQAPGSTAADTSKRAGKGWLIPAAGAILLAILAVLFLAPQWFIPAPPAAVAPADTTPPPAAAVPGTGSPYSEAELAQARREAQDILAKLLAEQKGLEANQVELWADQAFEDARALALEGDARYRERDFPAALTLYQQALDALAAISASLPEHLTSLLATGHQALAAGDEQAASTAFQAVLTLQPDHSEAQQGLERATLLPQTRPLLATARQQQASDQLEEASATLEKLLALDKAHDEARNLLATITDTLAERAFDRAMSEGLVALRDGRLEAAATAFRRALTIRPGHADASSGLAQVNSRQQANTLARQLSSARELESSEQWRQAADLYARLRADDESLVEARIGAIRSAARAELDAGISRILDDPLRLASSAVYNQGRQLLADARAIAEPGPRLQAQTAALAQALAASQVPITVRLESDNRTRVTLLRVAELGTFSEHSIDLKPGHYVAVGSRAGYRDVRVEFQVASGAEPQVQVVCKDPV